MAEKETLGWIGLGTMGAAMCSHLVRAGHKVNVWNRTRSKADELCGEGAVWCDSPQAVGDASDIVFLSVSDGKALREVVQGTKSLPGLADGSRASLVVDTSTVSPKDALDAHMYLASKGKTFLDSPVTGGDVGARNGTLTFMVGGGKESFERVKPYVDRMAKQAFLVGPIGSGQRMKAVNQVMVALSIAAMTEGLVLAEEAGLSLEQTLEVVSGGAAGSWTLANYGPRVLKGDLNPGFRAKHMLKDLNIALEEMPESERQLPMTALVTKLYESLVAHGYGSLGNHALTKLYRGA